MDNKIEGRLRRLIDRVNRHEDRLDALEGKHIPDASKKNDAPEVKAGQWWRWPTGVIFELILVEDDFVEILLPGASKSLKYGHEDIKDHATLILDPDWPIEVGG